MRIKERYHRFRAWQKTHRRFSVKDTKTHHCACCDNEFKGNYCPVCGQAAGVGHITWQSLWKNVTMLWGMDSHSMPYSLWQLLWRPGYFIGEYIDGHRQVSYPPVKMLFVLAVFYVIIRQILGFEPNPVNTSEDDIFEITINWLKGNPAWAVMAMTMFFSIPTWFLFRFSPRHSRHTLPEGFFIQLFMASLMLICILLEKILPVFILLIPIYYYITYRQIFSYNAWGTLWRLALAASVWTLFVLLLATIALLFSGSTKNNVEIEVVFVVTIPFIFFIATLLLIGYWISRWTEKNRQKTDIHSLSGTSSPKMVK